MCPGFWLPLKGNTYGEKEQHIQIRQSAGGYFYHSGKTCNVLGCP